MQKFHGNLLILLGCLLVAVLIEASLPHPSAEEAAMADLSPAALPYQLGPFTGREAHGTQVKGYPGEIHRVYRAAQGNPVELLAFPAPFDVHGPENCLPYMGWSFIERRVRRLAANPAVELETVIAVSGNPSQPPMACGFYWRVDNTATVNLLAGWMQQRWARLTESMQQAELVTICTKVDDIRRPQPATERVYSFANDLEPYFHRRPPPLVESAARRLEGP